MNIVIKKIKPLFTSIVTTKEVYGIDDVPTRTIINPKEMQGALKEYQKVLAVGSAVRDIKPGDYVVINPERFAIYKDKRKNSVASHLEEYSNELIGYNFPTIEVDGRELLLLQDRDIRYVVDEWEEEKPESPIIGIHKTIIT